jgi:hypothetical protein
MKRTAATVLAVLALLSLPALAAAQQSPFSGLPSAPATTPDVTVAAPSTSGDTGGLKTWQEFLIFGAGLVLLLGIGYAIVSDARNRAPLTHGEEAHGLGTGEKPNRSKKQRERARAKAKTGRAQRKRNRRRR